MARGYDRNVFINCPYDGAYRPLFEAVTFAVYDCGFYPRSAQEVDDGLEVRIQKIAAMIRQCRLAIHDISRTQMDRRTRLPRFNMPLELGLFLGAKLFGAGDQKKKAAVILDTQPYRYRRYISDIAGQDIQAHEGRAGDAVKAVRNFLASHTPEDVILPGGELIIERYRRFRAALPDACRTLGLDPADLTFGDLTRFILGWMKANPFPEESP
jgi:hypothetical protein